MGNELLYPVGQEGFRVTRSGKIFREINILKGAKTGMKIIALERKYGKKNIAVVKKGNKYKFYVLSKQKIPKLQLKRMLKERRSMLKKARR